MISGLGELVSVLPALRTTVKPSHENTMIEPAELSVTDNWVLFSVSERSEAFSFTGQKKN